MPPFVAATGTGERIVEHGLGRRVHRWMADGASPKEAASRAVDALEDRGAIGLIVLGETSLAAAADPPMAWAARRDGSDIWSGPAP